MLKICSSENSRGGDLSENLGGSCEMLAFGTADRVGGAKRPVRGRRWSGGRVREGSPLPPRGPGCSGGSRI
jgi:hypothetical protein